MYKGNYCIAVRVYRHLIGDVSSVCSLYATSYNSSYPLMLVFDGGTQNYPEFQILLFHTEIGVNLCILADWPSPRQGVDCYNTSRKQIV